MDSIVGNFGGLNSINLVTFMPKIIFLNKYKL